MERWTELRTAFQVAKLGTVSAAARALGAHRATINRHIDILEEELGARIFIRNPKGYALTEFGEELLKITQKADELIEDLAGRAKGGHGALEGEIKITSLLPISSLLLGPIAAFRAKHSQCQVTIITTEDLQRLEYGEAHIALRAGAKPEHPDYVVQSFGTVALTLYGHRDYLAAQGYVGGDEDLSQYEFVLPPRNESRVPVWAWIYEKVSEPKVAVQANDPLMLRDAVLAGLGLGVLSELDVVGRQDVQAILPAQDEWAVPLWLVTHVDLHRTAKVQEMLGYIKASRSGAGQPVQTG